ncbi:hypothetical protein OIU34_23735 [Pararhizobium sp. BT-229]|uniref:hypothetical protein n=1 Tax=Pararhizobium sp. BT-229 TaxID=2986923 RepID=UPI0021F6B018|nr:hypothetical protein [Pararhizobium sp. BT-229]MCV9964909.1 hypothetical protein [Pararhizobium sp. BT-229]
MKIDFQLPVVTSGVVRGQKKTRQVLGTVPVSIDIREVRTEDLAHVASVFFPPGTPDEMTEYFHADGGMFMRIGPVSEFSTSFVPYGEDYPNFAFSDAARLVRRHVDNYAYNGQGLYPLKLLDDRRANQPLILSGLSEIKLESWYEEGVAGQVTRFEERCERLIVSDGCLYVRVPEPVLALDFMRRDGGVATSVRPIMRPSLGMGKGKSNAEPPHAVFRLDELPRLFDFCRASGMSEDRLARWTSGRVVVHDRIRLSLESDRASLYCAASRLTRRIYGAKWVPDHPLVDDVYRLVKDFTENDVPDELGDVLGDLVALHRSGTRIFDMDFEADATDHVVQMWDNREIVMAPGNPPATSLSTP